MTGLKDNILDHLNRNWETRKQIIHSPAQKQHDEGVLLTLNYLRQGAASKDISKLFDDERIMLVHSLKFDANSPEEAQSLKAAIAQLDEAKTCLNSMNNNPAAYKENEATFSSKKKEAGLPLDAAREFLKSHSTRLTNGLAGKGAHSDKLLLRQRKENLKVIRECYIELQKKALMGMESTEKGKGRSR